MLRRYLGDSGASAVEFVLVVPLLLVSLVAVVDLARIGYVNLSLTAASYEGARYSSLFPRGLASNSNLISQVTTIVNNSAGDAASLAATGLQQSLTPSVIPCSPLPSVTNENTEVALSTTFEWYLPLGLVDSVSNNTVNLSSFNITARAVSKCLN